MYRLALTILLGATLLTPTADAAEKRPMKLDDLFKFKKVSDPQVSPDGTQVVYTVGQILDVATNKTISNLWIAATDGKSPPRQLTTTEKKDSHPRWSPDGKKILFQSNRSGESQLWVIDLTGGEAKQLTTISTGAETGIWSRDGKRIAFVSGVYPENSTKPFTESDKLNKEKMEKIEKSPVMAKVHTRLFYRHWDSYVEDKRQHIFVMDADNGTPRDVTPGDRDAYPTSTTFSVGDDFTFSPDGQFIVFTAVPPKDEAWSTNYDICRVGINNASTEWETLTKDNAAADGSPKFSPDGKQLAFRRQKKAGYEADKWELMFVSCQPDGGMSGSPKSATGKLANNKDVSVDEFTWVGDNMLTFVADDGGYKRLFAVWPGSKDDAFVTSGIKGSSTSPSASRDGKKIAFSNAALLRPAELFSCDGDLRSATPENVSHANDALLDQLDLSKPESVIVKGANGDPMQMWILKPPGFDPSKKWPVAYLVHGGPQGAWEDGWSFRWCPQLWAAQGYVVALPNPRGSTGFGQKYVDEITGDWGGKCFEDLMKGVDYLETLPYVDKNRIGSAGASFGGYMMNWFATQTPRFKCLITHCSVYNFESEYTTTDELWFDEWEHGGPPWGKNRDSYEKHSPHRFAANLGKHKTPMLIIHNDLDFRCPIGQGIELFSALQRQGVPSRFVNFPDEGHWVLKPANSKFWHEEVFAWLTKHVPPGGR